MPNVPIQSSRSKLPIYIRKHATCILQGNNYDLYLSKCSVLSEVSFRHLLNELYIAELSKRNVKNMCLCNRVQGENTTYLKQFIDYLPKSPTAQLAEVIINLTRCTPALK